MADYFPAKEEASPNVPPPLNKPLEPCDPDMWNDNYYRLRFFRLWNWGETTRVSPKSLSFIPSDWNLTSEVTSNQHISSINILDSRNSAAEGDGEFWWWSTRYMSVISNRLFQSAERHEYTINSGGTGCSRGSCSWCRHMVLWIQRLLQRCYLYDASTDASDTSVYSWCDCRLTTRLLNFNQLELTMPNISAFVLHLRFGSWWGNCERRDVYYPSHIAKQIRGIRNGAEICWIFETLTAIFFQKYRVLFHLVTRLSEKRKSIFELVKKGLFLHHPP